ncbi:MAG: MBL fold metallo-hydrolase [Chloroflexi bacterium]|nr:MBL fold metallo-hydrolase [Chloroflexota bacterium]
MIKYAASGDVYLYRMFNPGERKVKEKQILWGDYLNIVGEVDAEWYKVKWGNEHFAIPKADVRDERPMEVIFLDVGQGDSCILTTARGGADERVLIIDAGANSNTNGYVKYRFQKIADPFKFHAAVITHPDEDHYGGFQRIFDSPKITFDKVYHNGIAERPGEERLGPSDASGRYLSDIIVTHDQMANLYRTEEQRGRMSFPKLMHTALSSGRVGSIEMLSTTHGDITRSDGRAWLQGFSPDDDPEFTIEILGPVVEPDPDHASAPRLRWFGPTPDSKTKDIGKTKNGHSILLRLRYRDFTLLFGGDLNRSAETFLLRHYGNQGAKPKNEAEVTQMVREARKRFSSDVMKSCHHGSSDVTDEFLEAVFPFAFIISSGDEESHVHPRPDLLGRLGKKGRSDAPLLLCTELLRSTREFEPPALRRRLTAINDYLDEALDRVSTELPPDERKALKAEIASKRKERDKITYELFKRNVGVYGAITLRTDGKEILLAFMREKPLGKKRWQTYRYLMEATGFELLAED